MKISDNFQKKTKREFIIFISLDFYFICKFSLGIQWFIRCQTPFSELTADFIATVIYLYRFAWNPIPLIVSQHDIITEIIVLYLQAIFFLDGKVIFLNQK